MTMRQLSVLGICLALVGSATATELIGNLPGNDGTQSASMGAGRIKAMGFTMPAGLDYFLDDVVLRLRIPATVPDPLVRIYSDVSGFPGQLLTTLVDPVLTPGGINNYKFTPPSTFTLTAGATYWIVAYTETGTYDWMASSPAQIPTGLATHAGSYWSGTSGPNPPTSPSTTINSYAVNGTIVPEPASLTLLVLAGLVLTRRR